MSQQVPAAPVRIHIQGLIDQGMTQAAICRAADVSSAYLSSLLYGQFNLGRTPQQTTKSETAARLLAVQFDESVSGRRDPLCAPGERFAAVGFRIGRCEDCGQLAPVQTRNGSVAMFAHPQPLPGAQAPEVPASTGMHPDCGTARGAQRHRREATELCGPCRWVLRGYDAGYKAATTKAAREARNAVPAPLIEAVVKACRAFAYRHPVPRFMELAQQVVRTHDAELVADDETTVA